MVRAVSFDVWNTLLDTTRFYGILAEELSGISGKPAEDLYRGILAARGRALRARLDGLFKRVLINSAELFAENLGVSAEELFRAVTRTLRNTGISSLLYSDVAGTLRELREAGYKLAVIGNVLFWPGMVTRYILDSVGVLDYFDVTVFSDEVGLQKPGREIFEYTAEKLGVGVNSLVHVGDSVENDLAGAVIAGAKATLVNRELETSIVRIAPNAYIVNSLKHLPRVLNQL